MVGLRRNSSPNYCSQTTPTSKTTTTTAQGAGYNPHSPRPRSAISNMTGGLGAGKSSASSASPTVWRKTSHPPLHFNNNEARHRDLQLQLKNVGTKDDWGASVTYDFAVEECTSSSPISQMSTSVDVSNESPTVSVPKSLYERFMLLSDNLCGLVRCIMDEAKKNTNSESCSLFLHDEENNELVSRVFDHAEGLSELRVPMGDGVVGRVAMTRTQMNVRDAHKCPFFYANVDELTGFRTRNILCFPIIDNSGSLVGVVELCNNRSASGFSRHDELYAKGFAVYCANTLSHCVFYKKIQEVHTRSHMAIEMIVQGADKCITEDDVMRLVLDPLRDYRYFHEHFDQFSFAPRSIGENHFHKASMMFFEDLGFTMRYRMNKRKLAHFVLRTSAGYRDPAQVPYHNWSHAFAVAHFCWLTLRTHACQMALDDLERLSLLIACLCHDIDHRGTTNSFQLQSKTPLAVLYSSEGSVLERHHYAQTITILHMKECEILENLNTVEYRIVLSNIREIILATDIAAHLRKAERLKDMVDVGYDAMSIDHHYLLMCLVMTASDLSDQSKNFRNAKQIAENIYKEFFAQGDLEKELSVVPLQMMDRTKAYVPQVQLEFLDTIGLPVFEMLSYIIPDGEETYEAIRANRECWDALYSEMIDSDGPTKHGLSYLRDLDIEKRVLDRVRRVNPRAAEVASKRPEDASPQTTTKKTSQNGTTTSSTSTVNGHLTGYIEEYQYDRPREVILFHSNYNNNRHPPAPPPNKNLRKTGNAKSCGFEANAKHHFMHR